VSKTAGGEGRNMPLVFVAFGDNLTVDIECSHQSFLKGDAGCSLYEGSDERPLKTWHFGLPMSTSRFTEPSRCKEWLK